MPKKDEKKRIEQASTIKDSISSDKKVAKPQISMKQATTPIKKDDPYLAPDPLQYIMRYISKRVKHEETLIKLIILVMASAYTPNPLNLALESPQSEGKSYSLVEVSKIFPDNDVWDLGGMTPQVLTREKGYHVNRETGENIEGEINQILEELSVLGKNEEDKETRKELRSKLTDLKNKSVKIIDMQGKILLFLEAPNRETFARLRPILSRDKYEIEYKFVDRAYKNGPQVTMEARIRGWPVAIYATADSSQGNIWDQIRSRFIVVSPNMNKKKYKAANKFTASKYGSISDPTELLKEDGELQYCMDYIHYLKAALYRRYKELSKEHYYKPDKVSFTWNPMANKLENSFPSSVGQHMRDFKFFMSLMDVSCLFSLFHRPYFEVKGYPHWIVTKHDLKNIIDVFDQYHFFIKIGELPINVFENIIMKLPLKHTSIDDDEGFNWKDLRDNLGVNGLANGKTHVLEHIIRPLEQVGLITTLKNKSDKRANVYVPFKEKYSQLCTNSFLKIKYTSNDFINDFNEVKNKLDQVTAITMNSQEFIPEHHFTNQIFLSPKESSKIENNHKKSLENNFEYKNPYSNINKTHLHSINIEGSGNIQDLILSIARSNPGKKYFTELIFEVENNSETRINRDALAQIVQEMMDSHIIGYNDDDCIIPMEERI